MRPPARENSARRPGTRSRHRLSPGGHRRARRFTGLLCGGVFTTVFLAFPLGPGATLAAPPARLASAPGITQAGPVAFVDPIIRVAGGSGPADPIGPLTPATSGSRADAAVAPGDENRDAVLWTAEEQVPYAADSTRPGTTSDGPTDRPRPAPDSGRGGVSTGSGGCGTGSGVGGGSAVTTLCGIAPLLADMARALIRLAPRVAPPCPCPPRIR